MIGIKKSPWKQSEKDNYGEFCITKPAIKAGNMKDNFLFIFLDGRRAANQTNSDVPLFIYLFFLAHFSLCSPWILIGPLVLQFRVEKKVN